MFVEGQLRECMEYAERNGITIFSHYIDRALSAKTDHRPEFQRMIKDSHKQLFDVVIVWKLDRFARNRYDSAHYKAILRKNGVKVISAKEDIAEDSTGILLESLLEGYAEFYSAELSEKVIRGLTDNALKTRYNGGGLPVGYTIDREQHFQIDPITAPLVLEAFTRYDQGATIKQLVDYLNERGLRSQVNRPMRIDVVTRLLHNRRYIVEYRYRDIVKEDAIPAIVPKDLFDRVQERLAKNKKAPARKKARDEEYLLTAKLFCGKCGASMIGESGTSHTGTVHRYYKCATAKKWEGCDKKSVKKEWIEELVVRKTMRMVYDDTVMEALADKLVDFQKRENTDIPLLKKQLAETAQGIENLLNAIQQGILTPSTKARLEQLEETKAQLETSLTLAELQKPVISREQFLFWLHRFRSMDMSKPTERQRLIDSFINAIYLYDDKIVLTFNYKDGSKTVSLQDVEGSDLGAATAPKNNHTEWCGYFYEYPGERLHTQQKHPQGVRHVRRTVFLQRSRQSPMSVLTVPSDPGSLDSQEIRDFSLSFRMAQCGAQAGQHRRQAPDGQAGLPLPRARQSSRSRKDACSDPKNSMRHGRIRGQPHGLSVPGGGAWHSGPRGSSSRKQLPPDGASSTRMAPPWASAMARTSANPSPAPPCWRERASSTRKKGSKICRRSSAGIPGPWSVTSIRKTPSVCRQETWTAPPTGLYLTAFSSRLNTAR